MNIVIADYGLSNLLSVQRAFENIGINTPITSNKELLLSADKIVLPGVGAFANGMLRMRRIGMYEVLKKKAKENTPILGICLGMQMLFDESDENGVFTGLGLISGRVEKISDKDIYGDRQVVPHISWECLEYSQKETTSSSRIIDNEIIGKEVYFIHSYEAKPENLKDISAIVEYGGRQICAAVERDYIFGTQFHPEKSGDVGLHILYKFAKI